MQKTRILTTAILTLTLLQAELSVPLDDPRIAYDGVWFPEISATEVIFNRHTQAVLLHPECGISATSRPYAYTQSGVRIRFRTASPQIGLIFAQREGAGNMGLHNGFAVYANGERIAVFETLSFRFDSPAPDSAVSFEIVLPSLHAVNFTGLELSDGYELENLPELNQPVYAAIGNSITHGTGHQSASFLTYPFVLAEAMDWNLVNLAVAGARTGWPIALLFKEQQVDFITIALGFNDWMWDNKTLTDKFNQYNQLLDTLRFYQDDAKIFCITPLTTVATVSQMGCPFSLQDFRTMLEMTVRARRRNGDSELYLVHGDSLSTLSMLIDGIHLSENGAPQFGTHLKTRIEEILSTTDIESSRIRLPSGFELKQNYPNTFNPSTCIEYFVSRQSRGQLKIFDTKGRLLKILADGYRSPGSYSAIWDGSTRSGQRAAGGSYIYRLETQRETQSRQMILLK